MFVELILTLVRMPGDRSIERFGDHLAGPAVSTIPSTVARVTCQVTALRPDRHRGESETKRPASRKSWQTWRLENG